MLGVSLRMDKTGDCDSPEVGSAPTPLTCLTFLVACGIIVIGDERHRLVARPTWFH